MNLFKEMFRIIQYFKLCVHYVQTFRLYYLGYLNKKNVKSVPTTLHEVYATLVYPQRKTSDITVFFQSTRAIKIDTVTISPKAEERKNADFTLF